MRIKKSSIALIAFVLLQTTFTPLLAQYTDHRNHRVDSLEQLLATNPPTGEELLSVYSGLAWGYRYTNKEKSMGYTRKCIDVATSLDKWDVVASSHRLLGQQYYGMPQYDSAMVYYNKALEAVERMREISEYTDYDIDDELSLIYGDIGNLYNMQGKNYEAIVYYQKAMPLFEKHGWRESQCYVHSNTGQIHLAMQNYEEAEASFLKSDSLAHVLNDSLFISEAKYHLACLYIATKEYDKALENAQITHSYNAAHPEQGAETAGSLTLLSEIYLEGYNDYLKAEEYNRQALALLEEFDDLREKAIALRLLSTIYQKRGDWRKAEQTALEALAADDSEVVNTMAIYGILAKAYAHLGDAAKSGEYFDKYDELKSLWSTKHYQSAIRDMEVKYETEKKETRIAALEDEKQLMIWLSVAGGAVLLLALVTFFLLWRWTVQKKRLAENEKELAEQQVKRLEQEKQLVATQAVLDGEIQERTRLARDLHDGLGSMLTGTKMSIEEVKTDALNGKTDIKNINNALKNLNDSSHELRRIAHHLMPDSLSRFGLKTAISDFCSTLPNLTFSWYGQETPLEPKLSTMIYRTIYELVNNALKHSGASQILVQLIQEPERIAFTVQDDGCGFDTSAATPGMGLRNIRTRVASFGGMINLVSSGDEGTEVNVEIRINL